jgi:hypothetical protein
MNLGFFFFFFLGHTTVDLIDKMLAKTASQAQWQGPARIYKWTFELLVFTSHKVFYDSNSLGC